MTRHIAISEIFGPVVQGEGPLAGVPTVFVRTGGCDYRCTWCDTLYAVDPMLGRRQWKRRSAEDVAAEVFMLARAKPIWVTLSGGNPAIQQHLGEVIDALKPKGFRFAIETQGTVLPAWADRLDMVVVSPKPPSSGMETNLDQLDAWLDTGSHSVLKVVVFDEGDLAYFADLRARYPGRRYYVQPGNPDFMEDAPADVEGLLARYRWLAESTLSRGWFDVAVLPQLHVLAFGGGRGQ